MIATDDADRGGLVVKQWFVDAFYDDVDELPEPRDGPADGGRYKGMTFDEVLEKIERETVEAVDAALKTVTMQLASRGVRLVVVER